MTAKGEKGRIVYLLSVFSIAVLAIANVILISAGKVSSISLGGTFRISVFNDKLTFMTSNNSSNSSNSAIWIHGSEPHTKANISFSTLLDDNSGETISSDLISTNATDGDINDISNTTMKEVTVSVNHNNKTPGVYQGSLFIISGTNKTSIPFTFDLKPNLGQMIILVTDGIAISMVLWKIIIYIGNKHLHKILKEQYKGDNEAVQNDLKAGILSKAHYIKNRQVYNVKKKLSFQEDYVNNATRETITSETIQIIGTIFFGIGVSVLGLLNNSYITNLHDIGIQEALVLIGIGLGIGSLKDFTQQLRERGP